MLGTLLTLVVTVFIFGLLIFIHEFGHYIVARLFGVGIIEFAVGMGPKIKTWKGKYNDFTLRAIPIGGFVNMVGEYDEEIPEEHKYKIPLNARPVWKRILIVLAGPVMNILLAFVIMLALVIASPVGSTVVYDFNENSTSNEYGLQKNDQIVEINGKGIHCFPDMSYKIVSDGIEPIDITVIRNGEKVYLKDVVFGTQTEEGILFGTLDFRVYAREKTFTTVISEAFWQSVSTVYMTVDSLVDTFTGRYGMDAVGGPIAVGGEINNTIQSGTSAKETVLNISTLVVMISVSLGIFNLLPIPVLDGGRLLFYIIEGIRRKPMDPKLEQSISVAFTMLLMALMVFVACKDIVGLF